MWPFRKKPAETAEPESMFWTTIPNGLTPEMAAYSAWNNQFFANAGREMSERYSLIARKQRFFAASGNQWWPSDADCTLSPPRAHVENQLTGLENES